MLRFFDTLFFTLERLKQHRLLAIWVLVGLSVATTLTLSLSLYVDLVYSRLLESRLDSPPYAFRLRYLGAWNSNITRADVDTATAVIQRRLGDALGLPVERNARFVRGGSWSLRLGNLTLGTFSLGILDGADDQITIVEGQWSPEPADEGDPLPVLAPESMLYSMGLQVGDELVAQRSGRGRLTLKVEALWRPSNPGDPACLRNSTVITGKGSPGYVVSYTNESRRMRLGSFSWPTQVTKAC